MITYEDCPEDIVQARPALVEYESLRDTWPPDEDTVRNLPALAVWSPWPGRVRMIRQVGFVALAVAWLCWASWNLAGSVYSALSYGPLTAMSLVLFVFGPWATLGFMVGWDKGRKS